MGQKVHPIGFRVGVYRDWTARWFAKSSYAENLLEDFKIRKYLKKRLERAEIADVIIEKAGESIRVELHSARPGLVIGRKGQEIDALRAELSQEFGKPVDVSVQEVKQVELNAELVAQSIASQIERRAGYKRLMKRAGQAAMKAGAKGIKICCSGRLAGSEIARSEWLRLGSVPLHTLRADVDHAKVEAMTTYGIIGVSVWICRGEYTKGSK
ncbi:MAG: 30S ribosomal protein S3 [Candidatus Dependentiae bacterium]